MLRVYRTWMFQFHKVRLKENIALSQRTYELFQFHKVRLKDIFAKP